MKKILCVAIALMLMAACMTAVFADEVAPDATVTVQQVEGVRGETVTLEVAISECTFATYGVFVEYDESVLTLVSITEGAATTAMPNRMFFANGNMASCMSPYDYTTSGVLFTVTFEVAADAAEGQHEVTITVDNFTKQDYSELNIEVVAGFVELAHVHSYEAVVTAPTCTEGGYTTYTCACGDSYIGDETDALGHTWGEWVVSEGNVCVGQVQVRECSVCHETEEKSEGGAGHQYDDGVVTTEPTCGASGVKTYTCSVCGNTYNDEIPATGEHNVADWTVVTEPTCTEKGSKTGYCTVCGLPVVEDIEPTGHVAGDWAYDDHNHWHVCSVCGEPADEAAAHTMIEVERVEHKNEEGYAVYECECGYSYQSTVPPTGDNNTVIIAAVAAFGAVAAAAYVTSKRSF